MDISGFIDDLSKDLAADTPLEEWADEKYEAPVTIYVNVDERDPPGADKMPLVVLYPDAKTVGHGRSEKSHRLIVECWLHDESLREHTEEHIIEYLGVSYIEQMRKLVENVITGMDLGDALIEEIAIEYDTITQFPMFLAFMAVTISESVTLGSDYFE